MATQTKAQKTKAAKDKAAKAKAAKAKAAKKQQDAAIANGDLIIDGKREFVRVDGDGDGKVEKRAAAILKALDASKTPIPGAELRKKHGGGWPQYLSMFAMLKAQGLVIEFRVRTGERGGSGVAYLSAKHAK